MTRLFITGASGLLGLNAVLQCRGRYDVAGNYYAHPVAVDGVTLVRLDTSDAAAVDACLAHARPDVVLHTAGVANVEECELNPTLARVMNTTAAVHVAVSAVRLGARLIHVSTDHLFDGRQAMRDESSRLQPLNVYAQTKADAEIEIVRVCPDALIVRTNFFGWGSSLKASFSDWILSSLRARRSLSMFTDVFFTPILVNDLIDAALALSAQGARGVYHVAGRERVSKHAFGLAVARAFGLDASLIHPASVDSFSFAARRPHDMSLSTSKASDLLGKPMPSLQEGIERLMLLEQDHLPDLLAEAIRGGRPPR